MSPTRSTWLKYGGFVGSVGSARVVGVLLTAITFPIIVRRLGVEMYGVWSYVIALLSFLDLLANPGLTSHAQQQVAARRAAAAEVVSDVLVLRAFLSVFVIGLIFVLAAFEVRSDAARLLRFYGISILLINLTGTEYLLSSLELFHVRSLLSVTQQALYTVGIVLTVHSPKDYMWVPASILISALPTNLCGWIFVYRERPAASARTAHPALVAFACAKWTLCIGYLHVLALSPHRPSGRKVVLGGTCSRLIRRGYTNSGFRA